MLDVVGKGSLDELIATTLPDEIRTPDRLIVDAAPSEQAVLAELREIAADNTVLTSMIGLGYYGTQILGHQARHPAEPGLVHGVHALPARDLPGPPRGALELPDRRERAGPASTRPTPRSWTRARPPPRR